jgi:hypothetical protein
MLRHEPARIDRDDTIAELGAGERELVSSACVRRAELELSGAAAFTAVTQSLVELRANTRIVDLSARAIAEEIRHSDIYLELARSYSAVALPALRAAPIAVPAFPSVGARAEALLRVVGMCSINETMACAFLELCLAGATAPLVRAGLREVLEDESRHARVGWAYLGSPDVTDPERRVVGRWLAPMIRAAWAVWRAQITTLPDRELPAHVCPSPAAIERAAAKAVTDLVLPGFVQAGVDVSGAVDWAGPAPAPGA